MDAQCRNLQGLPLLRCYLRSCDERSIWKSEKREENSCLTRCDGLQGLGLYLCQHVRCPAYDTSTDDYALDDNKYQNVPLEDSIKTCLSSCRNHQSLTYSQCVISLCLDGEENGSRMKTVNKRWQEAIICPTRCLSLPRDEMFVCCRTKE